MERFPSRGYMTPRTRMIRRLYFLAAVAVIGLIIGITLFSLSEKTQQEQPDEPPVSVITEPKAIPSETTSTTSVEPPRMVQQLPPPQTETEIPEAIEDQPKIEEVLTEINEPPAAQETITNIETQTTAIEEPPIIGASELIAEAMALLDERPPKVIEARDRLNELLPTEMTAQQRNVVKEQMTALADVWLFTPTVYPGDTLCTIYRVQSGDLLTEIGKSHNIPWEFIQELNKISRPEALQVGQSMKVVKGPFHARVFKSKFTMDLYLQDTFVKSFKVGLGKESHETPTGTWVVKPGGKLIKPTWTDPDTGKTYQADDPDYPLGSRWIGLEGIAGAATGRTGFAIHGTKDPHEIGAATSRGCIRLHNGDAILVYNLMMPGHSRIEVVD